MAQQRAAIPPLDQQVRQNIATLAVLLGEPPARLTVRGGSLSAIVPQRVSPGLPSDLLLQRPDIREAEAQLAAANANVRKRARRAVPEHLAHRPGRLCQHRAATRCSSRSPRSIRVAASLTQPVFDGFRLLSHARSAEGPAHRAAAALSQGDHLGLRATSSAR